jgi:hypothetical protein
VESPECYTKRHSKQSTSDNLISTASSLESTTPRSLILSASDVLLLIEMLIPQPPATSTPWDPFLTSSATAFAAQYRQGLPSLSRIFPTEQPNNTSPRQASLSISQSSAAALARKFDQVRHDLHVVMDRTAIWALPQPTQDSWAVFDFDHEGMPVLSKLGQPSTNHSAISKLSSSSAGKDIIPQILFERLDTVQRATVRLINEQGGPMNTPRFNFGTNVADQPPVPLLRRFEAELQLAQDMMDCSNSRYWWVASKVIQEKYPLCVLAQNDTRILLPIFLASRGNYQVSQQVTEQLQANLRYLEDTYEKISAGLADTVGRLDRLRDKMWYLSDVINSSIYEDARNVARALRNMAFPASMLNESSSASIRGRKKPRSLAESILSEPEAQTTSIMKAALDQGGPRKLADEQVDVTKRWIQRSGVDNFCAGEERIHRFCMEVRIAASRLVGETMLESPVLWSSGLYFRQRTFIDGLVTRSMPGSSATRPASILSEEGPMSYVRPNSLRGVDANPRLQPFDNQSSPGRKSSFHSLGSDRFRTLRDFHGTEAASFIDSPGRAVSATTADSINSFWSPLPTQPQSAASVSSLQSRPPSFINDLSSPRPTDQSTQRKVKFFEELRQRVISLMLSDLGSPVWSCGSETDAWLADVLKQEPIMLQLEKRQTVERLLAPAIPLASSKPEPNVVVSIALRRQRSRSLSSSSHRARGVECEPLMPKHTGMPGSETAPATSASCDEFAYQPVYEDLMDRFSRQVDPLLKLDALQELKVVVASSLHDTKQKMQKVSVAARLQAKSRHTTISAPSSRRSSLTPAILNCPGSSDDAESCDADSASLADVLSDQTELISGMKSVLMTTRPKTLFRDLQFITAFVPSESLKKTPGGKAFLQFGLAALAYKHDVCQSLVSVADKIMVQDGVKRKSAPPGSTEYTIRDAAQMWILAAKEGNETAQRELATLYLSHPEILPSVSLPLAAPRDIFKSEMKYWTDEPSRTRGSQSLCLALHWMQLAANNGDVIAKKRLKERAAKELVRR